MFRKRSTIYFGAAGMFLVVSAYALMWAMAASSLAFVECGGRYELFSSVPRCRGAAWAGLFFVIASIGSAFLLALGLMRYRKEKRNAPS